MAPPTAQKCRVACPLGNGKGPHPLGRGFPACPRGPPWHQYVGRWLVWVHPCAEKRKQRKRENKVSNPLGPNFCKAHISKLVCAPPFFLAFIAKSTSKQYPKMREKIFAFFGPPPPKKIFFSGHAIIKISETQEFSVFISQIDANRPKKRAHIYSKRS